MIESIIVKYYAESNLPLCVIGKRICEEVSTGTWTRVMTTTKKIEKKYGAKTIDIDKRKKIVEIAIPIDDFEIGNIPQFLSIVAGNVFGLKQLKNIRLLDVRLPRRFLKNFKGPRFGIEGIRDIIKVKNRPLVGTIVKPKIGLSPKQTAEVVYEAAMGGVDLIKDDETLTDQKFCPLEKRVVAVIEKLDKVKEETGKKILYATNITTRLDKLLERAELAIDNGANCLMIDIIVSGLSSIQVLRENFKLPIYCHRAGHAAVDKNKRHGIRWIVFSKLARMLGGDILHSGTIVGKMTGEKRDVLESYTILRNKWFNFKPVLPAASGGLHPKLIPKLIKYFGIDFIANFGGGLHGHPLGTKAGAIAVRQAIEATMQKISLKVYAKSHRELLEALKKWG